YGVGAVDVLVAARRRVRPERKLVAGDRRGHAQAGIGVDVVGADESPGELVEYVIVLGEQLPGDVERDAVRAVLQYAIRESLRRGIERLVPAYPPARLPA